MCDFSLKHVNSRPAKVGDKLMTHDFGSGTRGFRPADEAPTTSPDKVTAVCVLPGTKLKFERPIAYYNANDDEMPTSHQAAIFHQIDKQDPKVHHDLLDLPDGEQIYLTNLVEGQGATVEQLPDVPRTSDEAEQQRRAEYA